MRAKFILAGLLVLVGLGPARAQDNKAEWKPVFSQLFPKPTGENGYEELVQAADLAVSSKRVQAAVATSEPTLAEMRTVLAEASVQRALSLMRTGLNKPIVSPFKTISFDTAFPHLASFRLLSRLLKMQIYVQLADGRVPEALETMRDGLRLGYSVQQESLISGLVGVAIEAISYASVTRHLDQFATRDCERLIVVLRDYLNAPSPFIYVLGQERKFAVSALNSLKNKPNPVQELTGSTGNLEDADPRAAALAAELKANPETTEATFDKAAEVFAAHLEQVVANAKRPYYAQQEVPDVPPGNDIAARLAGLLTPTYRQVFEKYTQNRAQIQLLLLHVAIRRYRWEHQKLPHTLAQLQPFGVDAAHTMDPFTGKLLIYERKGQSFDLYSVGPTLRDEEGNLVPNQTRQVRLPGLPQPLVISRE